MQPKYAAIWSQSLCTSDQAVITSHIWITSSKILTPNQTSLIGGKLTIDHILKNESKWQKQSQNVCSVWANNYTADHQWGRWRCFGFIFGELSCHLCSKSHILSFWFEHIPLETLHCVQYATKCAFNSEPFSIFAQDYGRSKPEHHAAN